MPITISNERGLKNLVIPQTTSANAIKAGIALITQVVDLGKFLYQIQPMNIASK